MNDQAIFFGVVGGGFGLLTFLAGLAWKQREVDALVMILADVRYKIEKAAKLAQEIKHGKT